MLNLPFSELVMGIPREWREAVSEGILEIGRGLARWMVGEKKGQIATPLLPIGPKEVISEFPMSAAFITVAVTQVAIVGGVAISFYILNEKIKEIATSLQRLESKFDDQRWAIVAGAVDQLGRIEQSGNDSRIWRDLGGVRNDLSEAAAYHWRRLDADQTILSVEYAKFNPKEFSRVSKEALSNLVALAVSRFSLARALLIEGANRSARQEVAQAKEEIDRVVEWLSQGFLYYHLKKNAGWLPSKEHKKLAQFIQDSISNRSSRDTLHSFNEDLKRESAWFDNSLASDLRESWQKDKSHQDVEFLLSFSAEASTREKAYELCERHSLTSETYISFVVEQVL